MRIESRSLHRSVSGDAVIDEIADYVVSYEVADEDAYAGAR